MSKNNLEERVAVLERQVQRLVREKSNQPGPKDWLSTVGMFSGNKYMREIVDSALEYRKQDRRNARRTSKLKRKRAKS
jgi:hypothetical protein